MTGHGGHTPGRLRLFYGELSGSRYSFPPADPVTGAVLFSVSSLLLACRIRESIIEEEVGVEAMRAGGRPATHVSRRLRNSGVTGLSSMLCPSPTPPRRTWLWNTCHSSARTPPPPTTLLTTFFSTSFPIVGGSAIALLWLLSGDLGATQCGAPSKPQPTTWNGLSGIWRHKYSVRMACPTAKTMRIKLTRPSPRLVYHCNDAISRIQEGPRPWCTQARSLSARNGEDSTRPASASEVDLDARPCADRWQSCNAN